VDLEPVSGETLPKRTFVECFRIVCWQFLVYQEQLRDIPPFFDECPRVCYLLGKDKKVEGYCEGCDLKIAKDSFEQEAKAALDEKLEDKWKIYKFDNLLSWVYDAFDMKDDDSNLSVTADIMVNILVSEQNRQRRIKDYNRKLKEKE